MGTRAIPGASASAGAGREPSHLDDSLQFPGKVPLADTVLLRRPRTDSGDRHHCKALLNEGRWLDDKHTSWQPDGCMLHPYTPKQVGQCLDGRSVVFIGDSTVRQVFCESARAILQRSHAEHGPFAQLSRSQTLPSSTSTRTSTRKPTSTRTGRSWPAASSSPFTGTPSSTAPAQRSSLREPSARPLDKGRLPSRSLEAASGTCGTRTRAASTSGIAESTPSSPRLDLPFLPSPTRSSSSPSRTPSSRDCRLSEPRPFTTTTFRR